MLNIAEIGARIEAYLKAIKRMRDLDEVLDYMPKAHKKNAINIMRFNGKLAELEAEFGALIHENKLKSKDLMDRNRAGALSFDAMINKEQGLGETATLHKTKYNRKTFDAVCLEIRAKLSKCDVSNIPDLNSASIAVFFKTINSINNTKREALGFEFYLMKQDQKGIDKVIEQRKARMERIKLDRHNWENRF